MKGPETEFLEEPDCNSPLDPPAGETRTFLQPGFPVGFPVRSRGPLFRNRKTLRRLLVESHEFQDRDECEGSGWPNRQWSTLEVEWRLVP